MRRQPAFRGHPSKLRVNRQDCLCYLGSRDAEVGASGRLCMVGIGGRAERIRFWIPRWTRLRFGRFLCIRLGLGGGGGGWFWVVARRRLGRWGFRGLRWGLL